MHTLLTRESEFMMKHGTAANILLLVLLAAPLLIGCGTGEGTGPCDPVGDNFIKDPGFSTLFERYNKRQWHISEHSGGRSFEFAVDGGTLTIEKTGIEPWTLVSQPQDVAALAGQVIVLSAELKLDLVAPEPTHGFKQGGGLVLTARRRGKLLLSSQLEHEPHMGSSDWRRIRLIFEIPPGIDDLRLGVLHQAGGKMQIRNPSLRLVDNPSGQCTSSGPG